MLARTATSYGHTIHVTTVHRGRKIVKIRGAKICHAYVLHLSSWKDSLNDKRYEITKISYYTACMYM